MYRGVFNGLLRSKYSSRCCTVRIKDSRSSLDGLTDAEALNAATAALFSDVGASCALL